MEYTYQGYRSTNMDRFAEENQDSSYELCKIRSSFDNDEIQLTPLKEYNLSEKPRLIKRMIRFNEEEFIYNDNQENILLKSINEKTRQLRINDPEKLKEAMKKCNPFYKLSKKSIIFADKSAMKLANLDFIFRLTGDNISYFQPMDFLKDVDHKKDGSINICYASLAGGPGGFVEYMQYRWPMAVGYGITLRDKNSDKKEWNYDAINTCSLNRGTFKGYYGKNATGNLYTNADEFCKRILQKELGCSLVLANGKIKTDNVLDLEMCNTRLILSEIYTSLKILLKGGHLVLRIFGSNRNITKQLLFILSCSFQQTYLIKPVTSNPYEMDRYIVCKNYNKNVNDYINILQEAYNSYATGSFSSAEYRLTNLINVSSLQGIDMKIYRSFNNWISEINLLHLNRQLDNLKKVENFIEDNNVKERFDLTKCLIIWNLPDFPKNK